MKWKSSLGTLCCEDASEQQSTRKHGGLEWDEDEDELNLGNLEEDLRLGIQEAAVKELIA